MGADEMTVATDGILTAFQTLLVSTPKVEDFLAEVAGLAANVVVPRASCGITTHYNGKPRTIATSDRRAALADEHQTDRAQTRHRRDQHDQISAGPARIFPR
ncbi:hypothetical protein GCM10009744_11030 [Kribbella alba]|uniref:Uncharacterized protein n=1 Tax=Kribbella alba TaxID=190197 RepID=A0ABN2F0K6_9ACTN